MISNIHFGLKLAPNPRYQNTQIPKQLESELLEALTYPDEYLNAPEAREFKTLSHSERFENSLLMLDDNADSQWSLTLDGHDLSPEREQQGFSKCCNLLYQFCVLQAQVAFPHQKEISQSLKTGMLEALLNTMKYMESPLSKSTIVDKMLHPMLIDLDTTPVKN